MSAKKEKTVDLSVLDAKELASVRDQLDAEVQSLTQSAIALQRAAGEFGKSGKAIESLAEQDEGQVMLVPLTSSLYVNGMVTKPKEVLLDIGTGYFVQTSSDGGVDYCKRKVLFLQTQIQKVVQELKGKQQALGKVSSMLQQKSQAAQ